MLRPSLRCLLLTFLVAAPLALPVASATDPSAAPGVSITATFTADCVKSSGYAVGRPENGQEMIFRANVYSGASGLSVWSYSCKASGRVEASGSGGFLQGVVLEHDADGDGLYEQVAACSYDGVVVPSCRAPYQFTDAPVLWTVSFREPEVAWICLGPWIRAVSSSTLGVTGGAVATAPLQCKFVRFNHWGFGDVASAFLDAARHPA